MIFSKLLVLVLFCQIPAHWSSIFDCSFSNFCHPYGSSWWIRHADFCFQHCAEGKKYHCARDYDSPEVFREGCAVEKNCSAGEEPHLSFKESGTDVADPVVYCKICDDSDYYNSLEIRPSSQYSKCPDEKQNDCSKEKHKLLCKPEDSTDERFCRCDARNGYSPINEFSYEMCSYKNYDCEDYKCPDLPNGKPQQRLLNYTCAPYCDEGFDRLSDDSDDCLPVTTIITRKQTSANSTTPNISNTTSKPPVPTTTQKPVSDKIYTKIIVGAVGGSLGLLLVSVVAFCLFYKSRAGRKSRDKLCPYPGMFRVVMTFTNLQFTEEIRAAGKNVGQLAITQELQASLQKLLRSLPGDIQVRIEGYQRGSLIVTFYIETDGKATEEEIVQLLQDTLTKGHLSGYSVSRDRFECHKYGGRVFMEIIVEQPTPVANIIVPTPAPVKNTANTVVDVLQPNCRHLDRELSTLSAPLSEHEDVSTPNWSSKARKSPPIIIYKTTKIYQDTVLQIKTGNTQIAIDRNSPGSKNKNVKVTYNKKDAEEGEYEPLLNGEDSKDELEDIKSESSHEASFQQSEPIEEGKEVFQVHNQTADTFKLSQGDKVENEDVSGLSSAGGDDVSETSFSNELRNVEADSEGRPVTQKLHETQNLGTFYRRKRFSVSHESLFLKEHDIEDVGKVISDEAVYKSLINTVMDQCLSYLLDNMDPVSMVDRFTVKETFTHKIRRDILNMPTQTQKSRMIVAKIRETGKNHYQLFKVCLWETKQQGCLNKVLEVENKVLKENDKKTDEYSEGPNGDLDKDLEGQPDDEQTNDNNMDDAFNSLGKDSSASSQDKSQMTVEKMKDRSDEQELDRKTVENIFSDPTDQVHLPKHEKVGSTCFPLLSHTVEQYNKKETEDREDEPSLNPDLVINPCYGDDETNIANELKNVEADSEGKPVTEQIQETQKIDYSTESKHDIDQENTTLSPDSHQLNRSYLRRTCTDFGINSEEVGVILTEICNHIKAGSDKVLRVWPAYREHNRTDILFVVITDTNLASPKDINYSDDFEVVLRPDGDTNEENRRVIEHEVETNTYINDSRSEELRKAINEYSDTLREQHSNITMISASSMRSNGYMTDSHKMEREDCITLFVHIKGLIPIKEKVFPKTLGCFRVDVREDVFQLYSGKPNDSHLNLKFGCQIGADQIKQYGTLGGFIYHPQHGVCLLTSAHVLLDVNGLRMNKTPPVICCQPSFYEEANVASRCGELKHHKIGKVGDKIFVDVALVKIDKSREPVDGNFPEISSVDLKNAGFGADCTPKYTSGMVYDTAELVCQKDKPIIKYGATTLLRKGRYHFHGATVMVYGQFDFILRNQIKIVDVENCGSFAEKGDSGSLVFSVSDKGLVAVGLLCGGGEGYTIITPICDILHAIDYSPPYSLKPFNEVDDWIEETEIKPEGIDKQKIKRRQFVPRFVKWKNKRMHFNPGSKKRKNKIKRFVPCEKLRITEEDFNRWLTTQMKYISGLTKSEDKKGNSKRFCKWKGRSVRYNPSTPTCTMDAQYHCSWDYAIHSSLVQYILGLQESAMHVFDVCAERSCKQTFYLLVKASGWGSELMAHHYLEYHGMGEIHTKCQSQYDGHGAY